MAAKHERSAKGKENVWNCEEMDDFQLPKKSRFKEPTTETACGGNSVTSTSGNGARSIFVNCSIGSVTINVNLAPAVSTSEEEFDKLLSSMDL